MEDLPPQQGMDDYNNEFKDPHDYPDDDTSDSGCLPPELDALQMRLLPIRHIEALLIAKLVPPNEEEPVHVGKGVDKGSEIGSSWRSQEVFVRPGMSWKGALARDARTSGEVNGHANGTMIAGRREVGGFETPDEPQEVLHACRRDMIQLWNDPGVRSILKLKKIRLEEFPGL